MDSLLTIPGYKIIEIVDEGLNTIIYRAMSKSNQEQV